MARTGAELALERSEPTAGSITDTAVTGPDVTGQTVYTNTSESGDIKNLVAAQQCGPSDVATIYEFIQQGNISISSDEKRTRSTEFKQLAVLQYQLSIDRDGILRTCRLDERKRSFTGVVFSIINCQQRQ